MQQKNYYVQEVLREKGNLWRILLDYTLPRANAIEFVVPKDITKWETQLVQLLPWIVNVYVSERRWQRRQSGKKVFARFKVVAETQKYVESIPRLEEWICLHPEDPALYDREQALLWMTSHEGLVFIWLTASEAELLNERGCSLYMIEDSSPPTSLGHG